MVVGDEDRSLLMGVAYRLLGSVAEAEDAVQEAYARWYALPDGHRAEIASPVAWMVTAVSRVCLDVLGSARSRRVRYVGEWLPEPVSAAAWWTSLAGVPGGPDPAERMALDESLSTAVMVVLETMTPAERIAFVLHDVFGYRFGEIGEVLGRSPGACRQLAASARRRVREAPRPVRAPGRVPVVEAFKAAWQSGDLGALVALLDPEATVVVDGGGLVSAATAPISGAERVAGHLLEVHRRLPGMALERSTVNALPGLVARDRAGRAAAVVALDVGSGRVRRLWVMRNPEKLTTWGA